MKFRISFDIDASGTSYSIKNKKDEISLVTQNLSLLFARLQSDIHSRKLDILSSDHEKLLKDALIAGIDEEGKLVSQLFHNWKVEGTMEDGKTFTFTHKEPGYQEEMIFH